MTTHIQSTAMGCNDATHVSPAPNPEQRLINAARIQVEAAEPAHPSTVAIGQAVPLKTSRTEEPLPAEGAFPGYAIVRKIHGGGQGVVYQAVQKSTGQRVALKVIREGPFADTRNRRRLERGVRILGELNHPHIVRVIDSGEAFGALFYAMDFIDGVPLGDWLDHRRLSTNDAQPESSPRRLTSRRLSGRSSRRERTDIEQIIRLFIKICDAVNAAHVRGVIHRDLKPGNIVIDGSDNPHILDFDLAKIVFGEIDAEGRKAEMTQTGEFLGSLPWASPEQVERNPSKIDTRTDVYSIGVMLFESLAGQAPYPVMGTRRDLEDHILNTDPPRPGSLRRHIDDDLDTIILKCLAKPRERRYQSAGVLADDLRSLLAGAPISARRDNTWYLLRKLMRRHAVVATALVAVIVSLISATAISIHFYRQADAVAQAKAVLAQQEVDRANEAEQLARDAQNSIARLSFGWFLLEFQRGNMGRAREILDTCARDSSERLAMQFLLDDDLSEEVFLSSVPGHSKALAYYAIGERAAAGDKARAIEAFKECVSSSDGESWYREAGRVRIRQLSDQGAEASAK
jgi:serine/threonine protein kinase